MKEKLKDVYMFVRGHHVYSSLPFLFFMCVGIYNFTQDLDIFVLIQLKRSVCINIFILNLNIFF